MGNEKSLWGFLSLANFTVFLWNYEGKENAYGFLILRLSQFSSLSIKKKILRLSQWKENGCGLFILRLIVPRPPPFVIFSFDIHGKWKENAFRFFLLKPISLFPLQITLDAFLFSKLI